MDHAAFITGGVFISLLILEAVLPLRPRKAGIKSRWFINFFMNLMTFATGTLAVRSAALYLMNRNDFFGLLYWLDLPLWGDYVLGFLAMDLSFYYWHRLNHQIPLLWRFHNVHHIDPDLDVTTSFRFHPGEILYSTLFRAIQVLLLGISPAVYITFELVFQMATMFHHANLRLPLPLEKGLNTLLVTPRMHGIHHSIYRNETNSNYSVIFSLWDRLNRSIRLNIPQPDITIGVPAYLHPEDNALKNLLAVPFLSQKPYWQTDRDYSLGTVSPAGSRHILK